MTRISRAASPAMRLSAPRSGGPRVGPAESVPAGLGLNSGLQCTQEVERSRPLRTLEMHENPTALVAKLALAFGGQTENGVIEGIATTPFTGHRIATA